MVKTKEPRSLATALMGGRIACPRSSSSRGSGNGHPAAEGAIDYLTHRVAFTVNHAEEIVLAQGLSADL